MMRHIYGIELPASNWAMLRYTMLGEELVQISKS